MHRAQGTRRGSSWEAIWALRGLLRTFNGERRNLIGAEQSDRLRVELLLHQLRLVRCTTGAKIDPGEKPEISEQQQDRYGFHDFPWVISPSPVQFGRGPLAPDYPQAARER